MDAHTTHTTTQTTSDTELDQQRPSTLTLITTIALVVIWVSLMSRFGSGDVYVVMGPYACVVIAMCIALSPRQLLQALACDGRGLLWGLGIGVLMTSLVYPAFDLAVQLVPALQPQVAGLYHVATSEHVYKAFAWILVLGVAEELLFRGILPRALQLWLAERTAFGIALLAYSFAQLGSGSWIVFLLALVCGAAWSGLRLYTGSLTPGLIAHAIFSPTVLLLHPVTQT
jgi:membrane protease YdiL (CAAX protease family)